MKLHLNLTLRRALMAAMAMVTLHTAEADLTTKYNKTDAYVTGEGTLTEKGWNDIWNKHKSGTLTVGSYEGSASVDLTGSTYNSKNGIIFIGGTGHNSNGGAANDGTLNVSSKLNVDALHVGLSQKQCSGTLDIDGGEVTAGSELTVGGYAGTGIIDAVESTITVGTDKKTAAIFRVGYHNGGGQVAGSVDSVSLTNSKITVGAAGGAKDLTSIGHEAGASDLNLDNSEATFYDQTIVGEMGAQGTIHVHNGSTLTMEDVVLGYTSAAKGTICVEDSEVSAENLVVGKAAQGVIELEGESTLTADYITLGDEKDGSGTITAADGSIDAGLLTIGDAGKGSVISSADITADAIVIGNQVTGTGSLVTEGSVKADSLYVGYKGTGSASVNGGKLEAKNAYVVGAGSVLNTTAGTTELGNATVLGGKLTTSSTGTTKVTGELILDEAGQLVNAGTTDVASATVAEGAGITATGGKLTIDELANGGKVDIKAGATLDSESITNSATITNAGTLSADSMGNQGTVTNTGTLNTTGTANNYGTIANTGSWNISGEATSTAGTIANDGALNVSGTLTTGTVTGAGTIAVANGASWDIAGKTAQSAITNNGDITIGVQTTAGAITNAGDITIGAQTTAGTITNDGDITVSGAGRVDADSLAGTGTTTITIDASTVTTSDGLAIVELGKEPTSAIKVDIDTANAAALVGKGFDFVKVGDDLISVGQDNFSVDEGWTINWADNTITTGDASKGQQITYTGDDSGMVFNKLGSVETKQVEVKLPDSVTIELEVVTETVLTATATPKDMGTTVVKPTTEEEIQAATSVQVENDTVIHAAEITTGVDEETHEDIRTNVVIGKDVESSGSGSTKVQSVVVNQKTTIGEGENATTKKETIGASGVALVLDGKTDHKGAGKDKGAELGFNEGTKEGSLTVKHESTGETIKNEVKKIDIVQVEKGSEVSVSDMSMHSTHALTIAEGTTITFTGVDLHVGGTTDMNLTKEVEVKVYDEEGNVTGTKTETVDSGAHLTVDSTITKATVKVEGGSVVKFEKIDDKDHSHVYGSTTFKESEVEIESGSTLGDNTIAEGADETHMQTIVFDKDSKVTNHGNVTNAKFSEGSELKNNGGKVEDVVFEEGTKLKGTGHVKDVHVKKGGKLTVGSSPGVMNASDLTVDGDVEFYVITNSKEWDTFTGNSSELTTNYGTGSISQLVVDQNVTLNGKVSIVYQEKLEDGTYADCANQEDAKNYMSDEFKKAFMDGDGIQFITGNMDEISFGDGFWLDETTLPDLDPGMFWDLSELFTTGIIYVQGEILEEPTRIANSLVSAGETVLSFGRLAQTQAFLREAGTTRTWASALGMSNSIDSGSNTNGYDYTNWGAAVGVDHAFTKNTVVGVAFGCSWGENEAEEGNGYYDGGSIDQDAKMIGIYGVHKFKTKGLLNDVKLNAFAAYGTFENDSTRNSLTSGNVAKADWDSDAWVLSASLSRDITADCGVVFTPYVGVEYTKAGMDDFTEEGKSSTADYTADEDYSNLSVKVGVTVSKDFDGFTPYASIAYINDVDRSAAEVTAEGRNTVTGKSALPGRDAFQIGAGFNWQLTETLDLNAGYSAEFRSKATEQSANVGIGLTF